MGIKDRLAHAWNAFKGNDYISTQNRVTGPAYSFRPDQYHFNTYNEKSIVTAVLTRIAIDCSMVNIEHARVDENENYVGMIKSKLNDCLKIDANVDQTGRAFMLDAVYSLLDEGVVAIVPVEPDINPKMTSGFDVTKLRTGKVLQWYPKDVQVRVFNEDKGIAEDIILPKKMVCLPENPFYQIMNEPNSTVKRVTRILNKLDILNEQNTSGKLALIIQLPYDLKSPARQERAEHRRKLIEQQLAGSKYGIAYIDSTERITQINRAIENNMLSQVEYFMKLLYSQFGISENVMNGTADEEEMAIYYDRVVNPIMASISEEMTRKFLSKTARTQKQVVWYFRDPFDLIPVGKVAEIADTFIRNEILTKNEVRGLIGFKPSDDPAADQLQNPNLYPTEGGEMMDPMASEEEVADVQSEIDSLDEYDAQLDELENSLSQSAFAAYDNFLSQSGIGFNDLTESEFSSYIQHYASKYYDPVYAHEYYEKHKKLKGRNHLSEKGKEVADYVTKKINEERDKEISSSKSKTSRSLESAKNKHSSTVESSRNTRDRNIEAKKNATKQAVENHKAQMDNQIQQLRDQLATWGKSGLKGKSKEVRQKIARLREENNEAKAKLQDELSSYSYSEREAHGTRTASSKSEYDKSSSSIRESGSKEVAAIKEKYSDRLATEMGKIMKEFPGESKSKKDGSNSEIEALRKVIQENYAKKKKK